jgi:hypothetical protein
MKQLPAQVQKMSDRADALIKEKREANKPTDKSVEEKPVEEVDGKIKNEPTVKEPEHRDDENLKAKKKKPPFEEDTVEAWKGRYNALQGKYDAEIKVFQNDANALASLKSHVKHLTQRIQEGDAALKQLQVELAQKDKEPTPKEVELPESVLSLLSAAEREHLDEEGIDNKSIEIFGKLIKELASRIKPDTTSQPGTIDLDELKREVAASKEIREAAFLKELDDNVPGWREVNDSLDFHEWLRQIIPYTNLRRNDALQGAHQNLDHLTAIKMFEEYINSLPTQPKEPEPKKLQINPEEHIEPASTVGTGEIKPDTKGPTFTRKEVTQFYKDFALGKYTKDEQERIEADIWKANKEGNITS